MKKIFSLILVLCLTLTLVAGCGGNNQQDATGEPDNNGGTEGEQYNFAVVVHSTQSTYWQTLNAGAVKAGEEENAKIFFTAAPGGGADVNGQIDIMENLINQKVDGILLAASDTESLVPVTEKAVNAGIPVVIVDCGLSTDVYSSFIATDNYNAAAIAAEELAQKIDGEGKVAVINYAPGMLTGSQREQGFRDAIGKYSDITLLETQYYDNDVQKALEITQNLLTSTPDLKAIYATNEFGIVGACRALMEKNKKDVPVYGFDFSDDVLPLLEQGYCQGTIVQKPYDMGYLGVKSLIDVINGKEVEKQVDSGCLLATPENLNEEETQKVLYPMGK